LLAPLAAAKVPPTTVNPRAEVIDGVPLVPITASQRADCERLADHLKRRAPCPGLLPVPIPVAPTSSAASCLGTLGETACGPAAMQVTGDIFLLSQSNFQVPAGYVGVTFQQYNGTVVPEPSVNGGPLGHFVFMAGPDLGGYLRHETGKHVPPVPRYCTPPQRSGCMGVRRRCTSAPIHLAVPAKSSCSRDMTFWYGTTRGSRAR